MAAGRPPAEPRSLRRYLLSGENVVVANHQHWAEVVEPVASVLVGLVVAFWLDSAVGQDAPLFTNLIWYAWIFLVARMLYRLVQRRHDWFVATDKRLLLFYGLVTQKVAMMPLPKVTDMSYVRSPLGRMLGYGRFVLESAGQDQALREVKWVPNPDQTYRLICQQIFSANGSDDGGERPPERSEDVAGPYGGPPSPGSSSGYHGPVQGSGYTPSGGFPAASPGSTAGPSRPQGGRGQVDPGDDFSAEVPGADSWSTAIPVHAADDEQIYLSPDLRKRGIRDADTGPIPLFRPRPEPHPEH